MCPRFVAKSMCSYDCVLWVFQDVINTTKTVTFGRKWNIFSSLIIIVVCEQSWRRHHVWEPPTKTANGLHLYAAFTATSLYKGLSHSFPNTSTIWIQCLAQRHNSGLGWSGIWTTNPLVFGQPTFIHACIIIQIIMVVCLSHTNMNVSLVSYITSCLLYNLPMSNTVPKLTSDLTTHQLMLFVTLCGLQKSYSNLLG